MSRAHVHGFDTNSAQFERLGNPWVTPREQQELGNSPVSRKTAKQNKRPAKTYNPDYRDAPRVGRELTEREQLEVKQRDMMLHVLRLGKARRGEPVREVKGYEPRNLAPAVKREEELSEFHPQRIADECARLARRAAAEKRAAEQVKIDQLGEALAKFEKKARKVFG